MSAKVIRLRPKREPEPPRPALPAHAAADLDQAELCLLSLESEVGGSDLAQAAYLLGLVEGHLANMIEIVRGFIDA